MSEVEKTVDGVQPDQDGVEVTEKVETTQADDKVDYVSFKRAVDEKKRLQAEKEELAAKVKSYEEQKLESEGNKDQIIQNLRKELQETATQLKSVKTSTTWEKIENQIQSAALKSGCKNPEKLMLLLNSDDIKGLEVDDKVKIHPDDLNRLIDKAKEENEFLFGGGHVRVSDGQPTGQIKQKTLKDLTQDEKKALRSKLIKDKFF